MKIKLFILLLFLHYIKVNGQCTDFINVPDINFKTALLEEHDIDENLDGEISCTEALNFNGIINVENKNIVDLKGIEAFENVTLLSCGRNPITSIDISKNTALILFNCDNSELTNLNISNNTALRFFDCSFNQLKSIDISNNIALERLECDNNELTNLNVSNNIALEILECDSNELTNLNVSKNTALIELDCYNNLLEEIDVSKNTALIQLDCYNNQLKSIDVSKNIALKRLQCNNNELTSLNLANGNNAILKNSDFNFSSDFTNNPNLICIQVDDVDFSNTNWLSIKDDTANYNENCIITLSSSDVELKKFNIYPNPIENILTIRFDKKLKHTQIISLSGYILLESNSKEINVSLLPSGVYFAKITATDYKSKTLKFVKR